MILAALNILAATSAAPASEAIGEWIKVFFYLSGGICAIVVALRKKQPVAQPLKVQAEEEYVTRREFEALEVRIDEKIDGISAKLTENNAAGENRVIALHERINRLPGEFIDLLRKTKGLL